MTQTPPSRPNWPSFIPVLLLLPFMALATAFAALTSMYTGKLNNRLAKGDVRPWDNARLSRILFGVAFYGLLALAGWWAVRAWL